MLEARWSRTRFVVGCVKFCWLIVQAAVRAGIRTRYRRKRGSERRFDWCAVLKDHDFDLPVGWGPTQAAAIADLQRQLNVEAEVYKEQIVCVPPVGAIVR